uniref:DNA topoisomerase (ATP-hydrolyzing) n=1 Tax=viral metagenome TaxID=1070528 RepID=A0A6C0JTD6_9ZZZZ
MATVKKVKTESTLQHFLRCPDVFAGSNACSEETVFLYKDDAIVRETIQDYNECLLHVFKEVLDNCIDNVKRKWTKPQTYIKIEVKKDSVKITNDGAPIPVRKEMIEITNEISKKTEAHKMYRTQALFSIFRSGTNSDNTDEDDKIGRNGLGSKCTIAISKYVKIHHGDPDTQRQLTIEYKDQMSNIGEPVVTEYTKPNSFFTFEYHPAFKWFGLTKFSENHIANMHALAVCAAYISGCKVTFNGQVLKISTLEQLGKMFFGERESIHLQNDDCELLLMEQSLAEMEEHGIRHLSFVNGSFVRSGGTHVNANTNKVGKLIAAAYGAPLKETDAKKFFIYVVNYRIKGKLRWSGQTKAALTHPTAATLNKIEIDKKDITKIKKWNVWNEIATFVDGKTNRDTNKKNKTTTGNYIGSLPKEASDAYLAGKARGKNKCTIFICEGLSAKGLIDAGVKYQGGSDYVGTLALRGKLTNVLKMDRSKQTDKHFLQLIRKMIGLKMGCKYMDKKECEDLRYSKVIISCDEDNDGWHINLLLTAFIRQEHPGLIKHGILNFLETPVIKTFIGKEVHRFFLRQDFDDWAKDLPEAKRKQAVNNLKYIKGLGGHNNKDDAKFIFSDQFFVGQMLFSDKKDDQMLDIFFGKGKEKTKEKKLFMDKTFYNNEWIHQPRKGTMTFSEYIESRYVLAIDEQIHRAIPYVYDGLIESKKEIVYTSLKKLKTLTRTDIFSMSVAVETGYSHGSQNLPPTVTRMSQPLIGVNNIVFFNFDGIYGSRFVGSDDNHGAAAARYTYVEMQPLMKCIFKEIDNPILEYDDKDGSITSPRYYLPVVPWFAINGLLHAPANTYSTSYPSYNPDTLVEWLRWWIGANFKEAEKHDSVELVPWFRGFRGTFEKYSNGWISRGILKQKDANNWVVEELSADRWGCQLKEILEGLADEKKIDKPRIMNINTNTIKAEIKTKVDFDLAKSLASVLETKMATSNMTLLYDKKPCTAPTIEDHLDEYARRRYKGYKDRRRYMLAILEKQLKIKEDKIRFIKLVLNGTLDFKKIKDKEELVEKLLKLDFTPDDDWNHLTSMTMLNCTKKGIEKLEEEKEKVEIEYKYYEEHNAWQIWLDDLDEFCVEYKKYLKANPIDAESQTWEPPKK